MKITVIIHTYNAERQLQRAIDSVKGFDEILVCDMESTDSTREIAEANGCRVEIFPKENHTVAEPARDFAIKQASSEWVLVVDADEVVTPELRQYLYKLIAQDNCPDGLWIPRQNFFMDRPLHCHYPDLILRFFRRDKAYWPPVIHSMPTIDGSVDSINPKRKQLAFIHLDDSTISSYIAKTNIYTDNEVERRKDKKHYGLCALIYRPFFRFFKTFFIKGGFRDGRVGYIRAVFDGYYQFIIVSKLIERRIKRGEK